MPTPIQMIPVYFIGYEVEREDAWRLLASGTLSVEEQLVLIRAIKDWDETVRLLRRPAVNDNEFFQLSIR